MKNNKLPRPRRGGVSLRASLIQRLHPRRQSVGVLHRQNKGFGIIEALISITIGALILTTFSTLIFQNIKINRTNTNKIKATMYLQELIEITKDLEQSNWNALINNGDYYAFAQGNEWKLSSGNETIDNNYIRWLTIEDASLPGHPNPDLDTKKITAKIIWDNGMQTSQLETYVYKY